MAEVDRMTRRREHQRARIDHVRQCAGIACRVGGDLGRGHVTGRAYERLELPVGHRRPVDPEAIDGDVVRRRLLAVVTVRSHAETAARDVDHVVPGCGCDAARLFRWRDELHGCSTGGSGAGSSFARTPRAIESSPETASVYF